jgi:porin
LKFPITAFRTPFIRAGWSDGEAPFYNRAVSGRFLRYFSRYKNLAGISAAWNDPADDALEDQYTLEVFYRLQVWNDFAITADKQFLLNPALNPDEDRIWVLGLRARLAF